RMYRMNAGLTGRTAMTAPFVRHVDACLGCMACVTACPSGVQYAPLIEATRAQIERRYARSLADRLFRAAIFAIFPYPARMRLALMPLALMQIVSRPFRRRLGEPKRLARHTGPSRSPEALALQSGIGDRSSALREPQDTSSTSRAEQLALQPGDGSGLLARIRAML